MENKNLSLLSRKLIQGILYIIHYHIGQDLVLRTVTQCRKDIYQINLLIASPLETNNEKEYCKVKLIDLYPAPYSRNKLFLLAESYLQIGFIIRVIVIS